MLDDAGDLFQEGRAEAAKWPARFEVESLVELDAVVFVENDPAGKIKAGAAAFDLADRQEQATLRRDLRGDGEQENGARDGGCSHDDADRTSLATALLAASDCRFQR